MKTRKANPGKRNNRIIFTFDLFLRLLCFSFLLLSGRVAAANYMQTDPFPLEAGKPIERELSGGQAHNYKITLEAGQYLILEVDQRGIDVVVTLFGNSVDKAIEVDSPNGSYGPELISMIVDSSGIYRLEVRSLEKDASVGRYEVMIAEQRMASAQDRNRVRGDRAFAEARSLEMQDKAELHRKSIEKYEEAAAFYRAAEDVRKEAGALNSIGLAYNALGEKQKALDYLTRVLPLRRASGDRLGEAGTLNNIGGVYDSLGEKQKALGYYHLSLPLTRSVGDRRLEAGTLNNIGVAYNALDERQKALDYYHQSLPLSRAIGDQRLEAFTLNNMGSVYTVLGERQKALDYYTRSLPLSREMGNRSGEAVTLTNIGLVYYSMGEKRKSLEYFNQSLPLSRTAGDRRGEALTLHNIGEALRSLGEQQKALEHFDQSLLLSQKVGDRGQEAATLNSIGTIYQALGDYRKSLDYYNKALTLNRAVGDRTDEANSLFGIAEVETAQGELLDALSTIESALNIIESVRTKVVSPELRSSYFETAQDYYEFCISLLMKLHKLHPDKEYDRAALKTAERARARSLIEGLAEARLEIRSGADPVLVERERTLRQLLSTKTERQMRLLNGRHTDEQAAAVADEIKALTVQYQDLESEIRARSPRYAALTQPTPLDSGEIQKQVLDDRTLLLEYFLGEERSYLWVVSANSVSSYELPKREEIEEAALRVKKLLTARATRAKGEGPGRRQARIIEAESRYWEEALRLSRMILGPAMSVLSGKRLAIVPDGELQDVPFGALPVASGCSKPGQSSCPPLIVEHEIVSVPSASALAVLREETAGRKLAAKGVAVMADPVFDKDDERIGTAMANRSVKGAVTETLAGGDLLRASQEVLGSEVSLSRLPFSRAEAEAILSVASKATSLKALDFDASRTTATSDELSQYRIVHFATHGLLNKVHPELSGVVLSLVDREGRPQNGFLQLHDVYNLNLPAELVVLSACQTGLGKSVRGEGLLGLTRGFMYSGARRVVASLWGVQDLATAELMKRFYQAMLGEKRMRPAEALRAAQVEMWKQKRWQSPYYWGGFMMYGEW